MSTSSSSRILDPKKYQSLAGLLADHPELDVDRLRAQLEQPASPRRRPPEPIQPKTAGTAEVQNSFREFLLYFLRLGTFGFGGPIALVTRSGPQFLRDENFPERDRHDDRTSRQLARRLLPLPPLESTPPSGG